MGLSTYYLVGLLLSHFTDKEFKVKSLNNFPKIKGGFQVACRTDCGAGTSLFGACVGPEWEENGGNF